jgi:hypothetical protein
LNNDTSLQHKAIQKQVEEDEKLARELQKQFDNENSVIVQQTKKRNETPPDRGWFSSVFHSKNEKLLTFFT